MASDRFRLTDPDAPFVERYTRQFHSGHEAESVPQALWSNADWMIGNTVLGYIPLGLAYIALVRGVRRRWARWMFLAAFVAFLPNALYVVTDLIHLEAEGEMLSWSPAVIFGLVPVYVLFVTAGVLAYNGSLALVARAVRSAYGRSTAVKSLVLLHLASCCGIYLGRVLRLNSWEFVTSPRSVWDGTVTMGSRPEAIAYVATLFVVGGLLTLALNPLRRRLWGSADPACDPR